MIPRLMAEESLTAATAAAMGAGGLPVDERKRLQRQWAQAAGLKRSKAVRLTTPEEYAAIGIQVVRQPPEPAS